MVFNGCMYTLPFFRQLYTHTHTLFRQSEIFYCLCRRYALHIQTHTQHSTNRRTLLLKRNILFILFLLRFISGGLYWKHLFSLFLRLFRPLRYCDGHSSFLFFSLAADFWLYSARLLPLGYNNITINLLGISLSAVSIPWGTLPLTLCAHTHTH